MVLQLHRNLCTQCLQLLTPVATFAWEQTVQSVMGERKGR